ncbi:hypothetical protein [Halostella pelagica]|uniref:hypothetical protein n=1 Tax=Halostella pelagica TaxID=2583824 RepID=UPI0010808FC0|nr:hypothetical protein [Halostella pelagica]
MCPNLELESDAVGEDELDRLKTQHNTCNGFAFSYMENTDRDVIVKDGYVDTSDGGAHCYVYDRDRDVTIDVTLGQFNGCPEIGVWDGDDHPHVADWEEIREWESRDEFEAHYGDLPERDNPFYV